MSISELNVPALEVQNLVCTSPGEPPLRGITLSVASGEFVALLGPDGSGSETLCRCLAGLRTPTSGSVTVHRVPVGHEAWEPARRGLYVLLRGRHAFNEMSVNDNLLAPPSAWGKDRSARLSEVFRLFPVLGERRRQIAGTLSGGERQMLAIGRALMVNPRVLVIEDPFMGLSPKIVREVSDALVWISRRGVAVLITGEGARDVPPSVDRRIAIAGGRILENDDAQ